MRRVYILGAVLLCAAALPITAHRGATQARSGGSSAQLGGASAQLDGAFAQLDRNPDLLTASTASVQTVLQENPLGRGETLKVTPIGEGYHATAVVIQLAAGAQVAGHYHREHDEFIQVVRGECVMIVGRQRLELSAGSLVLVPAGISHGARAIGNGCAVVSTYSPLWDPKDRHLDPKADVIIDPSGDTRG